MPNYIKYSTDSQTLALKSGNFYIGTGDVNKGPTPSTGYWTARTPPASGYTVYQNINTTPSIYVCENDTDLINLTNTIAGQSYTSATQCLVYYLGQNDKMCLNIPYPEIVTNGLVMNLDAGFVPSYPRSGITWSDLSVNGNNGTLTNGPTFNSENEGSIVFDGTDDYVTNGNTSFTIANNLFADNNGSWSVTAWFKFPISPSGTKTGNQSWMIVGRAGGIATGGTFGLFIGSATDTTYGAYTPYKCACVVRGSITIISTGSVNDNMWHSATVTWNGSTGEVFFDGYKTDNLNNTVLASLQTYELNIGTTANSSNHMFQGNIGTVKIYNKALSATEILQNYNATKSRFGL